MCAKQLRTSALQVGALAILVLGVASHASAQGATAAQPTVEVYGFGQADAIADFKQNNPSWYDVNRPSRLPSYDEEFGKDGHFYLSARQSRFGVRGETPTDNGVVKGQFEIDMFGVGADAGQTTIRLRHAWGQWKQIGGGQTNSQFMDVDVFPNVLDYWGPNGMLFYRNVQVFWRPVDNGQLRATVAIEAPGASGDAGLLSDRVELQNVKGRFPSPDLTGEVKIGRKWGYVKTSGVLRRINYDDVLQDSFDLSGHVTGWGWNLSSNLKVSPNDVLRLQYVIGHGIQNYFNDAPVDVAAKVNPGNAVTPVVGEALPIQGFVIYLDHNWNTMWSTAAGYSRVDVTNSDLQTASAFKDGQYSSFNLLAAPVKNVMMGGEFQWAHRENKSDGFKVNDYRLQFSFKYSFSAKVIGG
jgi:outer membrane DcaP-like protein